MANAPLIVSENQMPYVPDAADTGVRRVRLFKNVANQAVRIPKEFELPGKDALMRREGNRLIIEAPSKPARGKTAALLAALEEIRKLGPSEDEFSDVDEGLLSLDDIIQ